MIKRSVVILFYLMILAIPAWAKSGAIDAEFLLLSPDFETGQDLPKSYACAGADINPPLEIYHTPQKTLSLAITVQDLDAPEGVWTHWVVYNIPPNKLSIAKDSVPGVQLLNDFGKYVYAGPCPVDERNHRLVFTAYALDVMLDVNEGWTVQDLLKAIKGHQLAKSELTTMYRKPIGEDIK